MYSSRAGPLKRTTPANVQCQKCLQRGHYSYECKAAPQERPYVARPSRTQQLRNPKLMPQLTNDALMPLQKQDGVADAELAKKEAERAKKRQLDDNEGLEGRHAALKRKRSVFVNSGLSYSTKWRSPRQRAPSAPRGGCRDSPQRSPVASSKHKQPFDTQQSYKQDDKWDDSRGRSRSIARSQSPPRRLGRDGGGRAANRRRSPSILRSRSRSLSPTRSPSPYLSEGPVRTQRKRASDFFEGDNHDGSRPFPQLPLPRSERRHDSDRYGDRFDSRRGPNLLPLQRRVPTPVPSSPPRELSLSPFSKRLAMTQAMNAGRA